MVYWALGFQPKTVMNKIVLCIPTLNGSVSAWTMSSVLGLFAPHLMSERTGGRPFGLSFADTWLWPYDLVRVRSRAVRKFLFETDATHLLFVDSDVMFEPLVIAKMLELELDCVAVAYPRRDIRWRRVYEAARKGIDPSWGAAEYVYTNVEPTDVVQGEQTTIEVTGVGMGCTLLSRKILQHMWDYYSYDPSLVAVDNHKKDGGKTVYLFAMTMGYMNAEPHLFGEDLSFCRRLRGVEGKCHLYIGDGAPASHVGPYVFKGSPQSFAYHAENPEEE
jgi:hypothetical protein